MPHFVLFSGHMIDRPDRSMPRFPASKEAKASLAIRVALEKVRVAAGGSELRGIAAAACGGDILFHEACRELHIRSEIYLGLPVSIFEETSVRGCGPGWESRYRQLIGELPVHILVPGGKADTGDEIWEKANEWMLKAALSQGDAHLTIIVLWDGDEGDTGGTSQMVRVALAHQANVEMIDIRSL